MVRLDLFFLPGLCQIGFHAGWFIQVLHSVSLGGGDLWLIPPGQPATGNSDETPGETYVGHSPFITARP